MKQTAYSQYAVKFIHQLAKHGKASWSDFNYSRQVSSKLVSRQLLNKLGYDFRSHYGIRKALDEFCE